MEETKKRNSERAWDAVYDMCHIFVDELKKVFRDEGTVLFFLVVPIFYPLLYSWIYTNEVVKDVPAVIVDDSHSFLSREFIRSCDACEGMKVVAVAANMEEAQRMQSEQLCHGIVHIPSDFAERINRGEQTAVTFFADMSGMLYYKGILISVTDVSLEMGRNIQVQSLGKWTDHEEAIGSLPLNNKDIQLFNPQGGYGSFLLPGVLMLIIQQTLLLGIGLLAGTSREKNKSGELIPENMHYNGIFRYIWGKSLCYYAVYSVISVWVLCAVPRIFSFIQLADFASIVAIVIPYLCACIFFGITFSCLMRYRENVILLTVFTSVPFLFLSGIPWPESAISGAWKGISYLIPSTFGINAYVKLNSLGASLEDVQFEFRALWIQALFYFITACFVYNNHVKRYEHQNEEYKNLMDVKAEAESIYNSEHPELQDGNNTPEQS